MRHCYPWASHSPTIKLAFHKVTLKLICLIVYIFPFLVIFGHKSYTCLIIIIVCILCTYYVCSMQYIQYPWCMQCAALCIIIICIHYAADMAYLVKKYIYSVHLVFIIMLHCVSYLYTLLQQAICTWYI